MIVPQHCVIERGSTPIKIFFRPLVCVQIENEIVCIDHLAHKNVKIDSYVTRSRKEFWSFAPKLLCEHFS